MHARVLIVICVVMATAPETLLAFVLDTAWSKVADDTRNSVMYFVETKQELFLFGEAPAVPAPITTPGIITDTGAASASTRAPATSPSEQATSTSTPTTSTSAPTTGTSEPATSISTPATSTSAPATSTSTLTTSTSEPSTSSNALLPSSTITPGYMYYPATGRYYKYHKRAVSWDVANTTCAVEGAHMVVLNDAEEADAVAQFVRSADDYYPTWTGLRDNRPGGVKDWYNRPGVVMDWRTVHGEPLSDVYNVWYNGQPVNKAGRTCAAFLAYYKRLYDMFCDWPLYFVCEMTQ